MKIQEFVSRYSRVTFLTGAGISTDSGVPDYRGPNGVYVRNAGYKPIQYQDFMRTHEFRQRYWARSFLGWPKISHAKPNESHHTLSRFQKIHPHTKIVTQNVDGLHLKSDSKSIEMHGALRMVRCTGCGISQERQRFQIDLAELNPKVNSWASKNPGLMQGDVSSSVNPDGDVEITWDYSEFEYPSCKNCGGIYKPDVVFFGENMFPEIRDASFKAVTDSDCIVVIGSSLTVFSSYRLVKRAHDLNIPICILNTGPTRADALATLKVDEPCSIGLNGLA